MTNDFSFLDELSEVQAKAIFYKNELSLSETEFKNQTYWVYQRNQRIGEILFRNGKWYPNISRIKCCANNPYTAAILELVQRPIQAIYDEEYSRDFVAKVESCFNTAASKP